MGKKFREHRNYNKIAAHLSDYGYMCSWLPVDSEGADFIAVHCKNNDVLKIQLKGRITIDPKYKEKNIYMAFPLSDKDSSKNWVIVPHDKLVPLFTEVKRWESGKGRSNGKVPDKIVNKVIDLSIVEPFDFVN
nr:hypothetical protein [Vagococcus proximus]